MPVKTWCLSAECVDRGHAWRRACAWGAGRRRRREARLRVVCLRRWRRKEASSKQGGARACVSSCCVHSPACQTASSRFAAWLALPRSARAHARSSLLFFLLQHGIMQRVSPPRPPQTRTCAARCCSQATWCNMAGRKEDQVGLCPLLPDLGEARASGDSRRRARWYLSLHPYGLEHSRRGEPRNGCNPAAGPAAAICAPRRSLFGWPRPG